MSKDKSKKKDMSFEKRKKQANSGKSSKSGLISQTCNLLNSRPGLNQESQFPTNLILNDEIKKYINLKKKFKVKKNSNKKMDIKSDRKKTKRERNHIQNLKIISNKKNINKKNKDQI